jgi:rSAM/selenodomain-associated transferase 2
VIVPTLNEEDWVETTLGCARSALSDDTELLVVDGGSHDATQERAARHARILRTEPSRGHQLHLGARAAAGEVLVFVHADTRLPPDTGVAILDALVDPAVVGGCCRFGVFPAPSRFDRYRLLEWGVNIRTRVFGSATGDQVIFVRREAYERSGGYPEHPLFEDVVLVRALRRLGRFAFIRPMVRTSRRRWEARGFWRTVVKHWVLRLAFWLGASPHWLAVRYR